MGVSPLCARGDSGGVLGRNNDSQKKSSPLLGPPNKVLFSGKSRKEEKKKNDDSLDLGWDDHNNARVSHVSCLRKVHHPPVAFDMTRSADVESSSRVVTFNEGVVTAAQASSGAATSLRTTTSTSPNGGCTGNTCSLWSLNTVAAAMHGVWFVVFVLLWALVTNEDGTKRDIEYPLWYSAATFGVLPDPPQTQTTPPGLPLGLFDTTVGTTSPYPQCDAPKGASVGAFPVSPAFRDSGVTLSLHWLVVSFFALSFLFQATAACVDAIALKRCNAKRIMRMGDDDEMEFEKDAVAGESLADTSGTISSWFRFVEYGFSASVMVVAIALQVGLFDAWLLFALALLTWFTMMLGLIAERVLALEEHLFAIRTRTASVRNDAMTETTKRLSSALLVLRWTAHLSAWVTMSFVFVVLLFHFVNSQNACEWADSEEVGNTQDDNKAPKFVYAIVFCELVLFAGFGLTQLAQFLAFDKNVLGRFRCGKKCGFQTKNPDDASAGLTETTQDDITKRVRQKQFVEGAYIVQSLLSKTALGWLVYGGNFAE